MALTLASIETPIGAILLVFHDLLLCALEFADHKDRLDDFLRRRCGPETPAPDASPPDVERRISAYFAGDLAALEAIPVELRGTEFQCRVWNALRTIPAGTTTTYARLAARIGAPRSIRAVGAANGANPISLVVPCHRVVGTNGALTGYGGGIARKAWLLRHEAGAGLGVKPRRTSGRTNPVSAPSTGPRDLPPCP